MEILMRQREQAGNKWSSIHVDIGTNHRIQFNIVASDDRYDIFFAVCCLHYGNQNVTAPSHQGLLNILQKVVLKFAYGFGQEALCFGWRRLQKGYAHFDDTVCLWVADQTALKHLFVFNYVFLGVC